MLLSLVTAAGSSSKNQPQLLRSGLWAAFCLKTFVKISRELLIVATLTFLAIFCFENYEEGFEISRSVVRIYQGGFQYEGEIYLIDTDKGETFEYPLSLDDDIYRVYMANLQCRLRVKNGKVVRIKY